LTLKRLLLTMPTGKAATERQQEVEKETDAMQWPYSVNKEADDYNPLPNLTWMEQTFPYVETNLKSHSRGHLWKISDRTGNSFGIISRTGDGSKIPRSFLGFRRIPYPIPGWRSDAVLKFEMELRCQYQLRIINYSIKPIPCSPPPDNLTLMSTHNHWWGL